jgi:hypothetical protein
MSAVIYSKYSAKANLLTFCKKCDSDVLPKVVFYHNEPDIGICPNCEAKVKKFKNSSRVEDGILSKVVALSIVVYLITLLVR